MPAQKWWPAAWERGALGQGERGHKSPQAGLI
eukprot:CAMPEP_0179146806 /NCGR_PEP_ID=MMETSP0796-20121207/70923_1 /TAXON_ID=73915 /ORGANISM="Pyrodinium bahamense, Strain pbaha01" /LENGTH=31 /DNA_ID= /DNA_START= /DNA_END= /DNA_ORIENTATION=